MTRRTPSYCPYCGRALVSRRIDRRERAYCTGCEEAIYQQPAPTAWVVVLDGERGLFVKRDQPPECGRWTSPGGFLEVDESAPEGAARELAEETGLRVDPDELTLVRTGHHVDDPADGSLVSICFAVERERTDGDPRAGDEPADARFWDVDELYSGSERTRPVDRRRFEAAVARLRGETTRDAPSES